MKVPNGRLSGDGSTQARRHSAAFGVSYPKSVFVPQNFVVLRKNCFKHMIKIKMFLPQKCILPPQALKPGYGPGSTKIVSAIRIFCFEVHSVSRCSITSKTFSYKSPLGGPSVSILGGGQSWADTALPIPKSGLN